MFYKKIIIFCFFPLVILGQGYYSTQTQNSFSQLSLNNNGTFSYTEESPIGNFIFNISGTYTKSNGGFTGSGWDSRSNSKVKITISLKGNTATIFINGMQRAVLTKR